MKRLLLFVLGVLLLPELEGANQRKVRFLLGNLFGNNNPPPATTQAPPRPAIPPAEPASFCQGGCQDGWYSYAGQCYTFVQEPMTWEGAERACQRAVGGGHLTSIVSAEHNEFLVSLATHAGHRTAQFWTGGSHQKGSSLKWTDGSTTSFIPGALNLIGNTINNLLNLRICLKLNINIGGNGLHKSHNPVSIHQGDQSKAIQIIMTRHRFLLEFAAREAANTLIKRAKGGGNWDGSDCSKRLPFVCSYTPNLLPP